EDLRPRLYERPWTPETPHRPLLHPGRRLPARGGLADADRLRRLRGLLAEAGPMGVRDGLPVRPTKIPCIRPGVAGELGRLRSGGWRAFETGVRGEDPRRHGPEAGRQQVALPARRPQEWIQQRDDAVPGSRREDVLPGGTAPPRFRRACRALPPQRRRACGRRSLPGRRRPPFSGTHGVQEGRRARHGGEKIRQGDALAWARVSRPQGRLWIRRGDGRPLEGGVRQRSLRRGPRLTAVRSPGGVGLRKQRRKIRCTVGVRSRRGLDPRPGVAGRM
ncbi:MAG: hypothetical protein AVDCRST_MAG58-2873, partial [uncultured Rubrobacteraceae bacterium]